MFWKIKKIKESISKKPQCNAVLHGVICNFYTDGVDHGDLEVNSEQYPEHEECVAFGSTQFTITDDKDICHNCGYVYE